MTNKILTIIKLGIYHPQLLLLALRAKRAKKTFLDYPQLYSLVVNFNTARERRNSPLSVAEFGVGRGGSAAILAWLIHHHGGTLTLFDIFSRIPPPTKFDGDLAAERYQYILSSESPDYYGNISNLMEVVKSELKLICPLDKIEFVEGVYEDTLPKLTQSFNYNLVHIDCDWYSSTIAVLDHLRNNLSPGAILQIDDYYTWQGSKSAVDEAKWLKPYHRNRVGVALVIDTGRFIE